MFRVGPWSEWLAFAAVVLVTMLIDGLWCTRTRRGAFREAANRSILWLGVGLGFSLWIAWERGAQTGADYLKAYVLEKSLSVDNLFVFLLIFRHFSVDGARQRRVLFWGVFGAVALRAIFILIGTELLSRFQWTFYLFGVFLVVSGVRMLRGNAEAVDPSRSAILRFAKAHLRTSHDCSDDRFFRRINGVLHVTPLFLVLLVVEFSDLVFAIDSVPAVLGITVDLYVVYTSNIMAILGLRALYFLLHGMMDRFHKLDWALSAVLVFVGVKMISHDFLHVAHWVSLCIIVGLLGLGIGASLVLPPPLDTPPSDPERGGSSPS